MKRWIAAMMLVLATAAPMARADEASKQAKVRELFLTMHMDHMMDEMIGQMTAFMKQQFQQMTKDAPGSDQMTAAQKQLTEQYLAKTMTLATESMGWKSLEPEYAKVYAATYSEAEIDGILAFYKSPAGQAMLAKTPELTAASMKIVQGKMLDLQPKVKAMQDEYLQQMKDSSTPK